MEILLTRYRIITDRGSGFSPGKYVETYWDDVALAIVVYLKDSPSDPTPTLVTTGPDLGYIGLRGRSPLYDSFLEFPVYDNTTGVSKIGYSFCAGPNLHRFDYRSTFPYTVEIVETNNFQCTQTVCDIEITDVQSTEASDLVTADGTITGTATTSNGVIRWGLDPAFEYSTGQLSGTFTGLIAGTYTLVAKDEVGCFAQVSVTLGVPVVYNVKYRLEFENLKGKQIRVDIEERGYVGDVIPVIGSDQSCILRANGDGDINRFTPIIPTEFRLSIESEQNFFYQDLFTQDDRKYKVKLYIDLSLFWIGFVIPQNYGETYLAPPYPVSIVATDGLADLQRFDFIDSSSNKFTGEISALDAIVQILKKTDLNINILAAINKYEQDMDNGPDDEPLNQATFEADVFYQNDTLNKCDVVLSEILKSAGARIVQRLGKWFIYCIEQAVTSIEYREFDFTGEYIDNGSIEDIKSIQNPRLNTTHFINASQGLEVIPAYGVFSLIHSLQRKDSLIQSFSFEEDDTYSGSDGLKVLKGWTLDISKDAGAVYGIKEIKSFIGDWCFFYKTGSNADLSTTLNYATLISIGGELEYSSVDSVQFGFDYAVILRDRSIRGVPYLVKIQWMLKVGDYYYNESVEGSWTTDEDYKYNDIYVKQFNDPTSFKKVIQLREVDELTVESFDTEIVFHRQNHVDFIEDDPDDHLQLKAIPTVKLPDDKLVRGTLSGGTGDPDNTIYTYVLSNDFDNPDAIQPDDYDGTTNKRVWILENTRRTRGGERTVEYFYFDNIVLLHLPGGVDPPKEFVTDTVNNRNLKVNFKDSYLLNDIDLDVNNSERTYRNFYKLLNGDPTQVWSRSWRAGSGKLLELLSDELLSQSNSGTNKLTGSISTNEEILPSTILLEEFDDSKPYMFMGYEFDLFQSSIKFEILELIDTVDEDGGVSAGFSLGFTLGFRS